MPESKFEKFVFSLMMAFAMVSIMQCYNLAWRGFSFAAWRQVVCFLPVIAVIAMGVQSLIVSVPARKLATRFVTPGVDSPGRVIFFFSVCTTLLMCPLMSVAATLIFPEEGTFPAVWARRVSRNLPFALCAQLLIAGPLVRHAFRLMFAGKTPRSAARIPARAETAE